VEAYEKEKKGQVESDGGLPIEFNMRVKTLAGNFQFQQFPGELSSRARGIRKGLFNESAQEKSGAHYHTSSSKHRLTPQPRYNAKGD